jgi:ribosomal protein S18 acetylase RimI-like enzyme
MKGVRLFVRRATSEDRSALFSFFATEGRETAPAGPASALLGFLLGDLVASLAWEPLGEEIAIRDIWVARNLRRKRIARAMLAELDAEARLLGSERLVVRPSTEFAETFRRLGFTDDPRGTLTRPVERAP